jgi:aldose sugar dehydrogenase
MTLHPNFSDYNYLYLYFTSNEDNRIERYRLIEDELIKDKLIFFGIPVNRFHNGGRIKFGPDGYLYVTTGDASDTSLAQNLDSLAGKILRLDSEGNIPIDNPKNTAIYSYGHRNPQGIAWDKHGRLWATEHGQTSLDELNLIEAGKNYGWPDIRGDEKADRMESPVLHSGHDYTWAPSGLTYWDNSLFFAGLRGQAIYEFKFNEQGSGELLIHFFEDFGRIRNVSLGPDNMLYILTNNTDGRGAPKAGDDKLIKINPKSFR